MADPIARCWIGILLIIISSLICAADCALVGLSPVVHKKTNSDEVSDMMEFFLKKSGRIHSYLMALSCVIQLIYGIVISALAKELSGSIIWLYFIYMVLGEVVMLFIGVYLPLRAVSENQNKHAVKLRFVIKALSVLGVCITFIPILMTDGILKLFKRGKQQSDSDNITEEEILHLVDASEECGGINSDERDMIENIFDLNNNIVRDVMTHYMDVVAIEKNASEKEIMEIIGESSYSRFPVYEEDIGNITGVLIAKEYMLNKLADKPQPFSNLIRRPYFVPETMPAGGLLEEMKTKKQHMAIVVNEHGETNGIITMEDLLEEIVGNIYDESDTPEEEDPAVIKLDENTWLVHGSMELDDLTDELDIVLELEEDVDTVGGLLFSALTMIPDDNVPIDISVCGLSLHTDGLIDRRVEWVRISIPDLADNNK